MSQGKILFVIRMAHTIIYLIMAASVVFIFLSAIIGYTGTGLFLALILVGIESVVFAGSGMHCPLTGLAKRYGAVKGYAFDTFLPERVAKYTFRFFGTLLLLGLGGLIVRIMVR